MPRPSRCAIRGSELESFGRSSLYDVEEVRFAAFRVGDRKHHAGLGLLGKRAFDFVLMLRYWADSDLGPCSDLRDANHERGPGRLDKLRSRAPQRHRDWQFVRLRSFLRYIL